MLVEKKDVADALSYISKQTHLAIDTETTGLTWSDRLFSVQIATEDREYYFDRRVLGEYFHNLKYIFSTERVWFLQNAKYDMRMLHWEGWHLKGKIVDLEVLVRLDRNDVLTTQLSATAKREGMEKLDVVEQYITKNRLTSKVKNKYWDKEETIKHFDKVPVDIMSTYGGHDARITFDLCKKLLNRLDPRSKDVLDTESALIPICHNMEMRGALIDREYTLKMLEYESGLIHEAKREFLLITGKLYSGSKSLLIDVFTKSGEQISLTAKGNPSLTDDVLETFKSPAARCVQRIRYYEKRIPTYYSSFLGLCDDQGYIHPDMRQAGTLTGRFSYRSPNLQNIPAEDDASDLQRENLIRRCFIPPKNHKLVSIDYSAQEYRIMLAYAGQYDMIAKVNQGLDLHQATADMIRITRKQAKTVAFATLYGSGAGKLSEMLDIPLYEAMELKRKYLGALPMVAHLIGKVKTMATTRGYIYNWAGRKLHLPGGLQEHSYAMPNHLIQSSGADICKRAMVEIDREFGSSVNMFMQVHDSLNFYLPDDQLDTIPKITEIMESAWPVKNNMPMKVDVKISGKSMAHKDMEKYARL